MQERNGQEFCISTMDISQLLAKNNIPPDVIENITKNGITEELLPKLTNDHLKELCPHLATRLKLIELVTTAYAQTESNDSIISSQTEAATSSLTFNTPVEVIVTRCFPDFDLKTLLQTSVGGNSIIKFYETNHSLNNTKRNQLTDIIVKHIYTHIVHNKISYEEYNILAAKIVTIFPKESTATYFTKLVGKGQSNTGRPIAAKGKLVDKVRNLIFKYGDRRRKPDVNINEVPNKRVSISSLENTQECLEDFLWLKGKSEPWDEVIKKWTNTFYLRKEKVYTTVHDFFVDWPILSHSQGEALINIDLELRYPECGLNFYSKWNDFFQNIITLKNPTDETMLNALNAIQNLDEDLKIPAQISIITQLIPPKGRLNKKIKFSTQEAVDSLFILVTNPGDIDWKIEEQRQKATANKLPIQPYIILQGTLTNCLSPLLVIDNVKYKFTSISKAFDTLFKAFHVLDARYPPASDHIHLIIQRCVYKIKTKYDNIVPYVADILAIY